MKKKLLIIGTVIIAAVVIYSVFIKSDSPTEKFTFAQVKRGNITTTITSTGTLEAVSTVDVGTQISGRIAKIFVDYNSKVSKGQLLAIIDTTTLALQVRNAKASLLKAQAQYELAKAQYATNLKLYQKGFLADLDFVTSKSTLESDSADVQSAKSALQQAKTNLGYAFIYAPISGIIINKNVMEGNTVAASLQAPVLFSIAEDLSKMQILASVDESDIGQIKVGQSSDFTVEAYPDKKFFGTVVQIRLNSQVVSNVVEYTVVINADNKENLLLPGMTATVDFHIAQRNNVLLIPNQALGFQPDQKMLTQYKIAARKYSRNSADSALFHSASPAVRDSIKKHFSNLNIGRVWSLDNNGNLKQDYVVLGISDGKNTEIIRSRDLKEGINVIIGTVSSTAKNTNTNGGMPPRRFGRVL